MATIDNETTPETQNQDPLVENHTDDGNRSGDTEDSFVPVPVNATDDEIAIIKNIIFWW